MIQRFPTYLSTALLLFAILFGFPLSVLAVESFVQCGNEITDQCQINDLFSTAFRIINYLFTGAAVIAVGGVVYGGFLMVTSAGNQTRSEAGKKALKNALIGLAIVLLSVLIVQSVFSLLKFEGGFDPLNPGSIPAAVRPPDVIIAQNPNPPPPVNNPNPPPPTTGSSVIPGISNYIGVEHWPDADWNNTKPELRAAFNQFNRKWQDLGNPPLTLRQVFRSDEYARYIRSLWEYDQLINNRSVMRDLYGCENFTHITQADLNALSASQLLEVKRKIALHGNVKGPACKSDHGEGIAFDLTPPAASKVTQWIDTALSVGLCHHIPADLPHFALKSYLPSGTNCRVLQ